MGKQGVKINIKGTKLDVGKPLWHLLPYQELEEVVKVLTFGKEKYGEEDWKCFISKNSNWKRYMSACLRHISAFMQGEKLDKETNLKHLSHAICCLLFISWKENQLEDK